RSTVVPPEPELRSERQERADIEIRALVLDAVVRFALNAVGLGEQREVSRQRVIRAERPLLIAPDERGRSFSRGEVEVASAVVHADLGVAEGPSELREKAVGITLSSGAVVAEQIKRRGPHA